MRHFTLLIKLGRRGRENTTLPSQGLMRAKISTNPVEEGIGGVGPCFPSTMSSVSHITLSRMCASQFPGPGLLDRTRSGTEGKKEPTLRSSGGALEYSVYKECTDVWGIILRCQLPLLPAFRACSPPLFLCPVNNSLCCL